MHDIIEGIDEENLGTLSMEVLDYADRISNIFDKIDRCMEKLPDYYQGKPCTELINYYNQLTPHYVTIKENIISYSDDFITLIKKMQENDKYITRLFQNYTDDTTKKTKSIMK